MDANGLRFWMLADAHHWAIWGDPPPLEYDREHRVLRLASQGSLPTLPESSLPAAETEALARLQRVPGARDSYATWSFWDPPTRTIMAAGASPGSVPIYAAPIDETPTDQALGYDGVLYIAIGGRIVLQDRRGRWNAASVQVADFTPWRLSPDPAGGVWVLDRTHNTLGRLEGLPLPDRPPILGEEESFEPCEENPDPPRLTRVTVDTWPAEERTVALACSPQGRAAVLTWDAEGNARLYRLTPEDTFGPPTLLMGARYPYSLTWVSDQRAAVLAGILPREALVYDMGLAGENAQPVGDFYPLRDHDGGPFLHGVDLPPHYPTTGKQSSAPLYPLSLPTYARIGTASNRDVTFIDSGSAQTVWHRLYLEAAIPPNCGIKVYLAATNDPVPLDFDDDQSWHEHHFGETTAQSLAPGVPRGAWVSRPSELPFHSGLLDCTPEPERAGLFTVLIQRANRPVKALRGRFLQVRVVLLGDGRTTPELAALRVYASRFSYVDRYLPELYREGLFGEEADQVLPPTALQRSTPEDFLERFLDNFEGILTSLEDRISSAYLLTDPRTTPEEALEWLGSWIGLTFDTGYPAERRRTLLRAAPELYRKRGTLQGLRSALDIATGGACTRGEIVIVEDFRLRRTFATILGADLADEQDPLLAGLVVSGNSLVGDTLFLGDETRKEFLALYRTEVERTIGEEAAIEEFLESMAFQVTVLVHQEVHPQDLGLIQRVVEMETPAHVLARVVTASFPLLVSVASLVGVDTYLKASLDPQAVRVGSSQVGVRDVILRPPSLDPRLEGGLSPVLTAQGFRPHADAGPDQVVPFSQSFTLDAGGSRPAGSRSITRYIWTLLNS